MQIIEPDGTWYNHTLPANNFDHLVHWELLLVTLKIWQVSAAVSPLLPKQNAANCAILLLHNGMGIQDELPPNTQPQPMLADTTTHIVPTSPVSQYLNHM